MAVPLKLLDFYVYFRVVAAVPFVVRNLHGFGAACSAFGRRVAVKSYFAPVVVEMAVGKAFEANSTVVANSFVVTSKAAIVVEMEVFALVTSVPLIGWPIDCFRIDSGVAYWE